MVKLSKDVITEWIEKKYNEIEQRRKSTSDIYEFNGLSNQLDLLDEVQNFIDDETL